MQYDEITKYMEFLFSLALKKCGNYEDAEDLTQEVLTAALGYAKEAENTKAWLTGVLNHKYYDLLRRRYKLPTVSINAMPGDFEWALGLTAQGDTDGEWESAGAGGLRKIVGTGGAEEIFGSDNADRPDDAAVRREVAYLADKYREVTIRHYLKGERVQEIADHLGIPKGTVLSRLSAGRETMRKGLENMEQYEKLSYQPQRLDITCSGRPGMRGEPWSLVADDLMRQNILIAAYEKPVTCVEIARALGIPTAYIERAVEELIRSQLMVRAGNKVFTDFEIITPEQTIRGLKEELAFVDTHYEELCTRTDEYLSGLRQIVLKSPLREAQRKKLEHFWVLNLLENSMFLALQNLIPAKEEWPERPDGGSWIAVGKLYPADFDFETYLPGKYCFGGMRRARYENILGARFIDLYVYDSQPDLNLYEKGPLEIHDDNLVKLLYLIHSGKDMEKTGFDLMFLQDIPHLTRCGVLRADGDRPQVDIPVISQAERDEFAKVKQEFLPQMIKWLEEELPELLPRVKIDLPKHLEKRVAEYRKYSCFAIPEVFLKKAEKYEFMNPKARPPMMLVTEEA